MTNQASSMLQDDASDTERKYATDPSIKAKLHDLEHHIDSLRELDEHRRSSAELRDHGVSVLQDWITGSRDPSNPDNLLPGAKLSTDAGVAEALYCYSKGASKGAAFEQLARLFQHHSSNMRRGYELPLMSELSLMSVAATDRLVNEGRNLVIVALVGTDLHIRVFDASGNKVVDKAENELVSGETLTALKKRLTPMPDESGLSKELKQKIIGDATSIAGHTLRRRGKTKKLSCLMSLLNANPVPVLFAAGLLQALLAAPYPAFSKAVLLCYYWIVRELFTADAPDWTMGGARAAPGGITSAYVTAQCVDAILSFAKAQENTARFVDKLHEFKSQLELLKEATFIPDEWKQAEKKRLEFSYYVFLDRYSGALALDFEKPASPERLTKYVDDLLDELPRTIQKTHRSLSKTLNAIKAYRHMELDPTGVTNDKERKRRQQRNSRSAFGHERVRLALRLGQQSAKASFTKASRLVDPKTSKNTVKVLKDLSDRLSKSADDVRKVLQPTPLYLASVLDRELVLALSGDGSTWDPAEMAFAATALGSLGEVSADDKKLSHALEHLSRTISDRGLFPMGRPFHTDTTTGQMLYVYPGDIPKAFSGLLRCTRGFRISIDLVKRLLGFVHTTRHYKAGIDFSGDKGDGWFLFFEREPHQFSPEATLAAVQTLASINQMLDERINDIILDHFTVRRPERDLDLSLDELFYPDYGMLLFQDSKNVLTFTKNDSGEGNDQYETRGNIDQGGWPQDYGRTESVAITLQRMHAHVRKVPLESGELYSLVLHGPPGTGKTTLVEALAKSCAVPLVEVTPSDLVVGGTEAVERKARLVFEALSFLTRVVILFDEFDPVLWRRNPQNPTPENVFSFLTPGMLPKLKALHKWAEGRSVAYVLVTNLIGGLDEAAVREGRFDKKIGIYPPDVLSRVGRFVSQCYAFQYQYNEKGKPEKLHIPDDMWRRVIDIARKTAGGAMEQLGKPGWFTAPKTLKQKVEDIKIEEIAKTVRAGTPFDQIFHGSFPNRPVTPMKKPNREAQLDKVVGTGTAAIVEYVQWRWNQTWDDRIENKMRQGRNVSLEEMLGMRPRDRDLVEIKNDLDKAMGEKVSGPLERVLRQVVFLAERLKGSMKRRRMF